MELPPHPWFLGCQFHPELKSRPLDCHPLFRGLIRAAVQRAVGTGARAIEGAGVAIGFVKVTAGQMWAAWSLAGRASCDRRALRDRERRVMRCAMPNGWRRFRAPPAFRSFSNLRSTRPIAPATARFAGRDWRTACGFWSGSSARPHCRPDRHSRAGSGGAGGIGCRYLADSGAAFAPDRPRSTRRRGPAARLISRRASSWRRGICRRRSRRRRARELGG